MSDMEFMAAAGAPTAAAAAAAAAWKSMKRADKPQPSSPQKKTDKSASKPEHDNRSDVCTFHVEKRHLHTDKLHVKGRAGMGLFLTLQAREGAWNQDKIPPVQTTSLGDQAVSPLCTAPCENASLMMLMMTPTTHPEWVGELSTPSVTSQRAHLHNY